MPGHRQADRDPGTTPPPRTRSNSPIPVVSRFGVKKIDVSVELRTRRRRKRVALTGGGGGGAASGTGRSSTMEFQAPQSLQRPSHFDAAAPRTPGRRRLSSVLTHVKLWAALSSQLSRLLIDPLDA